MADASEMRRQGQGVALVGFLQAQNCSVLTASWRHPAATLDFLSPRYYRRLATLLEDGGFQLAFFDDRLAMPSTFGGDHRIAVEEGIRPIKLDPIPLLSIMSAVTDRLGLGATYSTTYYEPYHVARLFQTLDHISGGRAAWNVVTSLNRAEAENFGRKEHLAHDARYDRAEEFLAAVFGHWTSWDDDALVMDPESGVFADPDKVRQIGYEGEFVRTKGPFTVPRSPQGHPVIIQAGQSGRGSRFAAKWADLLFCMFSSFEMGQASYKRIKEQVADAGRDPDDVRVCPAIYVIVGETRSMAEDKLALLDSLNRPNDAVVVLSEQLDFDFSRKPMDEAFTDEELAAINGLQALRDRIIARSGKSNPTVRDFITHSLKSNVREQPLFCGTGKDVADQIEAWFNGRAADGFVIPATNVPGTFEDFGRLVSPELRKRGLLRTAAPGATLRDSLGLPAAATAVPAQ